MPRVKKTKINESQERDNFMTMIKSKSVGSQRQYLSQYDNLYTALNTDLLELDYDTIVNYLNENFENPNTKKNYVNIFILLQKEDAGLRNDLVKYRETLREKTDVRVKERNAELSETLPPYEDLMKAVKKYIGKQYVINYLLTNVYVRNQDLNALVSTKDADINIHQGNHLIISNNKIEFVRNEYKTARKYGQLITILDDRKLVKELKEYLGKDKTKNLLDTKQIDHEVRKYTYQGLSESNYLKIILTYYTNPLNVSKLYEIQRLRGTDINVILKNYNLGYTNKENEENEEKTLLS
tara:strand:- start:38 stop:925 length:888 start_codon:yes stop_codon:yes gene_type:complete